MVSERKDTWFPNIPSRPSRTRICVENVAKLPFVRQEGGSQKFAYEQNKRSGEEDSPLSNKCAQEKDGKTGDVSCMVMGCGGRGGGEI